MRRLLIFILTVSAAVSTMAHDIDFDKIKHWTGSGPNRAALAVQFNNATSGTLTRVWGYRWENGETPSGEKMFKEIAANSRTLVLFTQFTGQYGSTVCGIGYNESGKLIKTLHFDFDGAKECDEISFDYYSVNSFMGQANAPGDDTPTLAQSAIDAAMATHVIQHPLDQHTYGYPAYDYDFWQVDGSSDFYYPEDEWQAGWYYGYWSYWTGSVSSPDLGYSGVGFTGRQLFNGAIDGWSFSDTAEIGAGDPPAEGLIEYVDESDTTSAIIDDELSTVNPDNILTFIGEGDSIAPVVIRFNNPYAVDNIVLGYRYDGALPSGPEIMRALAGADSRFSYATSDQTNCQIGLDLNADGTIDASDNLAASGADGRWTFTSGSIGGRSGMLISFERQDDATQSPVFYLPAPTEKGVWIPSSLTVKMADAGMQIIAYVQRQSDGITSQSWQRSNTTEKVVNDATILSSATAVSAEPYRMSGKFAGKEGVTYVRFRPRFSSGYIESNWCEVTVEAPAKPITSLSWAEPTVDVPLSHTVENALTFEPADATFTLIKLSSSNTKVATASGTTPSAAKVTTTTTAGSATITATYVAGDLSASFELVSSLKTPVTDVTFDGVGEDGAIHLNPKQMTGLMPIFTPTDPDIHTVTVELIGGGTDKASMIASMYKVNYWNESNTRIQFYELSGHRAGNCTLKVTSGDGALTKEIPVIVEEPDRSPIDYTDGTFMLNEEWFGHTNGGMNYITPEGELIYQVYERENPGMSFGATSQYAVIWGGKLIACSKQAIDSGDPLPGGGRVVVADARTLKRVGSIDNLAWNSETGSADARAVAGATPSKVYIGSTKGVYVVDIDSVKVIGKVGAIENDGADLYSGQMGDMVYAAGHVFAIKQSAGVYVIDVREDKVVKFISASGVQGITVAADGRVWYAVTVNGCSNFVELDPVTMNEIDRYILPADYGQVACSWGAWRNTQFVGCQSEDAIWFATGAQGIAGGGDGVYYRFDTRTHDVKLVADIRDFAGSNARVKQKNYGTLRFDDRSGELIVMTCDNSSSGHYRYNWYHFFDPETATLKHTLVPRPYYWFQCFAIFPDKYDPEINSIEDLTFTDNEPREFVIADLVSDRDNIDANINLKVDVISEQIPTSQDAAGTSETCVADYAIRDGKLVITPLSPGTSVARLTAMSNGVTVSKELMVNVEGTVSGITSPDMSAPSITVDGPRVLIQGCNGVTFTLINPQGVVVDTFTADSDEFVIYPGLRHGIYLLTSRAATSKIYIR